MNNVFLVKINIVYCCYEDDNLHMEYRLVKAENSKLALEKAKNYINNLQDNLTVLGVELMEIIE